ncbi:MAG: ATP-binding protein, partial [Deltaproteobacteria bacterium]|nr:ATP-binding protein [Deltaproteobacteria bacterium]
MDSIVGREAEKRVLQKARESNEAELIAVYGRRRVGKTYLVSQFFGNESFYFELTGMRSGSLHEQLSNFADVLSRRVGLDLAVPSSWADAFRKLVRVLEGQQHKKKDRVILFFDEVPWLASRRSQFLSALSYFWNSWASRRPNIVVILCGSAASWMLEKVVGDKGGLHNRLTRRIRLMPFSLGETMRFLQSRGVSLDRQQLLQIFMVTGGIPQYLKQIEPGLSGAQNIDNLCFQPEGFLHDEFDRLYASLFEDSAKHISVVRALAKNRSGLSRRELLNKAGLVSGGTSSRILTALEESGFINRDVPFGKRVNSARYRLTDEYSLFYLTWIDRRRRNLQGESWVHLSQSRRWATWAGFSFEGICLKHIERITAGLGISGMQTSASTWQHRGDAKNQGAQVDLLIDRADHCVTICEIKHCDGIFQINRDPPQMGRSQAAHPFPTVQFRLLHHGDLDNRN